MKLGGGGGGGTKFAIGGSIADLGAGDGGAGGGLAPRGVRAPLTDEIAIEMPHLNDDVPALSFAVGVGGAKVTERIERVGDPRRERLCVTERYPSGVAASCSLKNLSKILSPSIVEIRQFAPGPASSSATPTACMPPPRSLAPARMSSTTT